MKMNKKKVLSLSLIIAMIAILSFSSLAWFSDADSVTNKFMMADSEADTPDEIFSVDVWELVDPDDDGDYDEDDDGKVDDDHKDQDGLEFEDILPGGRYEKKPTVENTGSYDQYIRVKATVTNADAWIAALGNGYDLGKMFEGHDETVWTRYDVGEYVGENNTYTMTFYLKEKLAPDVTVTLFDAVVIPSKLTQKEMVFIGGGFDLTILAEAVQTENLGEGPYEAFQILDNSKQDIDVIK